MIAGYIFTAVCFSCRRTATHTVTRLGSLTVVRCSACKFEQYEEGGEVA